MITGMVIQLLYSTNLLMMKKTKKLIKSMEK
jgi:hypothetical protein